MGSTINSAHVPHQYLTEKGVKIMDKNGSPSDDTYKVSYFKDSDSDSGRYKVIINGEEYEDYQVIPAIQMEGGSKKGGILKK